MEITRYIDRFVPASLRRTGLVRYRRARLIVGFSWLAVFWSVVFALLFKLVFDMPGEAGLSLAGAVLMLTIPRVQAMTSPAVAGNFLVLILFTLLGTLSWYLGGFESPLLPWYAVIPALAAMVTDARAGLVWTLIVIGNFGAFYALEMFGLSPPLNLSLSQDHVMTCVSLIGFMALLMSLTQLYENFEHKTLRRVRRANRELAQARDRALEASRAKTAFLANMSHEFRTPLHAIIGYSDIVLEESEPTPAIASDVTRIRAAGTHLLRLVNDLLDLSKIEAGKMELESTSFTLAALVDDLVGTLRPQLAKNQNDLKITCPDLVGSMHSDVTRVKQCLLNLLSNACKFTERGSVELRVSRVQHASGDRVRFEVVDTGIGMTEEQQQRCFGPFAQADASTSRRFGGTGLGLAICDRLTRILGGRLSVQSALGTGSTFTLVLPAHLKGGETDARDADRPRTSVAESAGAPVPAVQPA